MNTEHLIHEYLDGTLSSDQQGELFAMLAADEMAREELTSQIRLQTALRKDYAAVVVPADTAAGIFSELGLPVPGAPGIGAVSGATTSSSGTVAGAEIAAPVSTVTGASTSWDYRRIIPLLLLLLSFAVVYSGRDIVHQLLYGTAVVQSTSQQPSQQSSQQLTQQSTISSSPLQSHLSDRQPLQQRPSQETSNSEQVVRSYNRLRRTTSGSGHDNAEGTAEKQQEAFTPPVYDVTTTERFGGYDIVLSSAPTIQSPEIVRQRTTEFSAVTPLAWPAASPLPMVLDGDFELIARSAAFRTSNPEPDLVVGPIMDQPWALGIHYRLSDDHILGIDGGMERLSQEFTRVDFGVPTVYRQAPVIPWVGITYRLDVNDARLFSSVVPSASVTAAWTQIGPMARAQALLRFTPESRMSIFLGVEGSLTAYPIQSTFFTTSILQVTYGISYRF